jgi:hypothetical protein
MLIRYTQIAGAIEALSKTQNPQQEPKDGELPDLMQEVRFARLLVQSVVWYFVWHSLSPPVLKLVGHRVFPEKIALFAVYFIVSKWIPQL